MNINTANLSSTNLVNVKNNGNHELIAPNIPNLNSQNPSSHSNTGKFSFCFSWNTNGWNFVNRDGIEYFNTLFRTIIPNVFRKQVMVPMRLEIHVK